MTPEQQKERRRDYYRRNKEKVAAYNRKYKLEHRKEISDYTKKYSAIHPLTPEQEEKRREYSREYARTHRDYFNAKLREYRQRQKEDKNNACN